MSLGCLLAVSIGMTKALGRLVAGFLDRGTQDRILEVRSTNGDELCFEIDMHRLDAGDLPELGADRSLAVTAVHLGDRVGALCQFALRRDYTRLGYESPPPLLRVASVRENDPEL